MKKVFLLIYLLALCLPVLAKPADEGKKGPELEVVCVVPDREFYEREPIPVTVTLFSSVPQIASASELEPMRLKKGEFATFQTVEPAGSGYRKQVDGKTVYCFPLKTFVVSFADKGKYELTGGEYSIGVPYNVVIDDPFWGPRRTTRVKEQKVSAQKKTIKIKSLPVPGDDIEFSGSVGKFVVETIIPPGDIFLNEEATAIIRLRGNGVIAEHTLPKYIEAFGDGAKLKSVSESRTAAYDHGELVSELQLECTFIPTRKDAVIGEASFDYFDPEKGKYVSAKSKPVTVKVKSATAKSEMMQI